MGYMLCSQTGVTVPQLTETLSSSGQGQTQSESLIQCQSLKLKAQSILVDIDSLELYTSVSRSIYLFKFTYYRISGNRQAFIMQPFIDRF